MGENQSTTDVDELGYFLAPLQRGIRIHRTARLRGFRCEGPVEIRQFVLAEYEVSLGAYSYISEGTRLSVPTEIGRYCSIAHNCDIGGVEHPTDWVSTHPFPWGNMPLDHWPEMREASKTPTDCVRKVAIGHDVWIGTRTFIRNGVTIGTGAVVGAHAVVTRDVPPYAIVAGNPARLVRMRFPQDVVERLLASRWWRLSMAQLSRLDMKDPRRFLDQIERLPPA